MPAAEPDACSGVAPTLTRRDLLMLGGAAVAVAAVPQDAAEPAEPGEPWSDGTYWSDGTGWVA